MSKHVKLVVIGGFLGAGKTTALLAIAEQLAAAGQRVGIVTNDQGSDLVDTAYLRHAGFPVLEVEGGCFCCHFDQFSDKLAELTTAEMPDYILAEPVGSCTDLVATLMKPLRNAGLAAIALAPLSVVADPKRIRSFMRHQGSTLPNEIQYLFGKQLEEADLLLVNKTDLLDPEAIREDVQFLQNRFPAATVLPVSAKTGAGMAAWVGRLLSDTAQADRPSLELHYDTYARAEEMMGWLNGTCRMTAATPVDGNRLLHVLMEAIRSPLVERAEEIAHLKAYLVAGSDFVKMSLTGLSGNAVPDHAMTVPATDATLVVNIRAVADPAVLSAVVRAALDAIATDCGVTFSPPVLEAFRPAYPHPVHRMG